MLVIEYLTTDEQMYAWGWRVPFILALPWGLLAMALRSKLKESAGNSVNWNALFMRPDAVVYVSSIPPRSPTTAANRYDGFGNGSTKLAQWRPSAASPLATSLPFERSSG